MTIEEKFNTIKSNNSYTRIDAEHPLDIYVGYNESNNKTLAIIVDATEEIESTRLIDVKYTKRTDDKLNLTFTLIDSSMSDLYYKFCEDLIESSKNISKNLVTPFIIRRWKDWINLFKNPYTSLLSENEVKGLLGELIFLNTFMFNKYGIDRSINAWIGTSNSHKDYEIDETWYEIKTVKENATSVKISSIEQLDSEYSGQLVIIKLEPSNSEIENPISLNTYIKAVLEQIEKDDLKLLFNNKLKEIGYQYTEEYDLFIYSLKGVEKYRVNNDFPKFKKEDLKNGIIKVSYELLLNEIRNFKIEGD